MAHLNMARKRLTCLLIWLRDQSSSSIILPFDMLVTRHGVRLEDVQTLVGHADPRTTRDMTAQSARLHGILSSGFRFSAISGVRSGKVAKTRRPMNLTRLRICPICIGRFGVVLADADSAVSYPLRHASTHGCPSSPTPRRLIDGRQLV